MFHQLSSARRRAGLAVVAVASLGLAGLAAGTSYASGGANAADNAGHRAAKASHGRALSDPYVDVTDQSRPVVTEELRVASRVAQQPAARQLRRAAPPGVVTDLDGSTGTVRWQG